MISGKMLLKYYDFFLIYVNDMGLYVPWINSACSYVFSLSECGKMGKGREKEGKDS